MSTPTPSLSLAWSGYFWVLTRLRVRAMNLARSYRPRYQSLTINLEIKSLTTLLRYYTRLPPRFLPSETISPFGDIFHQIQLFFPKSLLFIRCRSTPKSDIKNQVL